MPELAAPVVAVPVPSQGTSVPVPVLPTQSPVEGEGDTVAAFTDVPVESWYAPFVMALAERGVVVGYGDGTFRPYAPVNRAELAKITAVAFRGVTALSAGVVLEAPFSDVPTTAWYAPFVAAVKEKGIRGYAGGVFRPDALMNRAEALCMIVRVAGVEVSGVSVDLLPFADVPATAWYATVVAWAFSHDVISGTLSTTFSPELPVSRAEVCKMVIAVLREIAADAL